MKIIDETEKFKDNIQKYEKIIVLHWLAGTAKGSVEWLNDRYGGKGSIAYYYIICKNGDIIKLGDPKDGWFHNSNLGDKFDKETIPIALEMMDENSPVTDEMIISLAHIIELEQKRFEINTITDHHSLYKPKPDFPKELFEDIMDRLAYQLIA